MVSLSELHYELQSLKLKTHYFILTLNKPQGFHPMQCLRMLRFGLVWSWGAKSKPSSHLFYMYIYIYVYKQRRNALREFHYPFTNVPWPGQNESVQCPCSAAAGRYLYTTQPQGPVKAVASHQPYPWWRHEPTHSNVLPTSPDNTTLLQWRTLPLAPSYIRPQATPHWAHHPTTKHLLTLQQLLCAPEMPQDALSTSDPLRNSFQTQQSG